jgi:uncharacterized membrane protein (DUF4010 family)
MLAFTIVGLAGAGAFALLDLDRGADLALVLVALIPLLPLVREMISKLARRQLGSTSLQSSPWWVRWRWESF